MKKFNEGNILIAITALKKIIEIFIGPFLTVYFIKTSADSLVQLSAYNIMNYIFLGLGGIIVGYIVRNKFQLGMFRLGIIINFIYILTIIVLNEKILNFLPLVSFLYGVSAIAYYYPYNICISNKVKNNQRAEYEFKKKTVSTIVAVITPIVLGGIITTTNFVLTAVIILIISFIQIILSFFIDITNDKNYKFTIISSFRKIIKNKDIANMLKVEYLKGLSMSDGVLGTILTILIFNAFKTDLNLGILSSISSFVLIIMQYVYTKKFRNKDDKKAVVICTIVSLITLIVLLINTNNITLIIYYFCYNTFMNVLSLIIQIRLFNVSNLDLIKKDNQMEFWSIREVILNLGRITGYVLLLIVNIIGIKNNLLYLIILITFMIAVMAYYITKIQKYENIE